MKTILMMCAICFSLGTFAQKETSVKSSIDKVTVFFQGAQIARSAKKNLQPGRQLIIVEKLTDFVDPNSVQVKALGDLTILSVSTRKNFEDLKLSNSEIAELTERRKKLEKEERTLADEYGILNLDKALLLKNRSLAGDNGLSVGELKEAYTFMHAKMSEITLRQTAIEEKLEELNKDINQLDQEIISQRSKPVINYSEVVIEVDVAQSTSSEFFVSYITPNASWTPYYDMRSDGIGKPVRLEAKALVSQTTGIDWDDVDLVLSTNDPYENTSEPILKPWYIRYYNQPQKRTHRGRQTPTFNYTGQHVRGEVIDSETGEPLPFTKVSFPSHPNVGAITDFDGKFDVIVPKGASTLKAEFIGYRSQNLAITAPYLKFFLQPEELSLQEVVVTSERRLTERERGAVMDAAPMEELKSVTISSKAISKRKAKRGKRRRKQGELTGMPNRSAANVATTAAVAVVQKDLRVEYTIKTKFSIPSNGVEQRVSIDDFELPANYEYHSAPKLDPSVYLVADVSGWEKLNLLNGESNLYFDGTYIGKTYVDANSLKDTLTFSLGKDSKMQIERKRISEKSSNRVFGSRRRFEVTWEINIRNNGGAAIPLIVKDQFPISQDADIKVKLGDYEGAKLDEKTKILTWNFSLGKGEKKTVSFDYKVDYDKSKTLYLE